MGQRLENARDDSINSARPWRYLSCGGLGYLELPVNTLGTLLAAWRHNGSDH